MTEYSSLPILDDLTDLERELIDAAHAGEVPTGSGLSVDDLAEDDDPAHEIRAQLVREMLLGQHGTFDPKGVRVRSVRVSGPLDLDNVSARAGLSLISCVVNGEISAWHANLPWLRLAHCRVGNVHADGARLESGMWLDDLRIAGAGSAGAVRLPKARIGNRLDLSRTEITNSTGAALFAPGLHVDGDLWLDETRFDAATRWAAVQLFQARIDGVVSLRKARIFNAAGTAFQLTN